MFESAELGHTIEKARYKREAPKVRAALLSAQQAVLEAKKFPVIVLIGGVDGAGKGETVNLLNEWMDPRHVRTHAMKAPTDEEQERPRMWRFWRALPAKGKVGIFFGSWYTDPILAHVRGGKGPELEASIAEIVRFEQMLIDEGALLVKLWFHLSKASQKARLRALEADKRTRWRVTSDDWKNFKRYDAFRSTSERVLRETSSGEAPWMVVEGTDARYRGLTASRALLDAMTGRLAREHDEKKKTNGHKEKEREKPKEREVDAKAAERRAENQVLSATSLDGRDVIAALDLTQKLGKKDYEHALESEMGKLNLLTRHKKFQNQSLVIAFEGSDAAGKGGAIRRVTAALDARTYHVIPIAAPTEEERAQPYLWRFWRDVPRRGHVTIYDRSWYGRVLVERVEGFCGERDWMRAYGEINAFEEQLAENGAIVCKFWLQISAEEQLRRFKEREAVRFKRYKITEEDWRNQSKRDAYQEAACDMINRTSTDLAPWTLVEAEDKHFARVKVLKTLVERLSES